MIARFLAVLAMLLATSLPARATDRPDPDQVRALTLRAAEMVAAQGVDSVRKLFHTPGEFRYGEIYVVVIDENGTWLVYPPNPRNEGKSVLNVTDADGVLVVREILKVAREKGEGWVDYRWLNPANNRIERKSSYVKRIQERGAVAYVGFYR